MGILRQILSSAQQERLVYGGELSSKFSYEINYKKVSSSEITIDFVFTAPDKGFPVAIEFEIARVAGEVFRGAMIETTPGSGKTVEYLPPNPFPRIGGLLQATNVRSCLEVPFATW